MRTQTQKPEQFAEPKQNFLLGVQRAKQKTLQQQENNLFQKYKVQKSQASAPQYSVQKPEFKLSPGAVANSLQVDRSPRLSGRQHNIHNQTFHSNIM